MVRLSVTEVVFGLVIFLAILNALGLCTPFQLLYSRNLILEEKQYWRLITCLLFRNTSVFETLTYAYTQFQTSSIIELQYFHGRTADYALFLALGAGLILLARYLEMIESPFLADMFGSLIIYLGSRASPNAFVQFFHLFNVRFRFLPVTFWVLNCLVFGFDSSYTYRYIISCAIAHTLWYFLDVFPRITGFHPLHLPL